MRAIPSTPYFGQNATGGAPGVWMGTDAVDGDRPPWSRAPLGSVYYKRVTVNQQEEYLKVKDGARNDDWVLVRGTICQRVDYSEFTDGGSTTGTLALNATIPIGAYVVRSFILNCTDATGVSTLTAEIGDGESPGDPNRYSTGTPSVASAATIISMGAPSGVVVHVAAKTPVVVLTEDDDFSDVTAWSATVVIEYTGSAV